MRKKWRRFHANVLFLRAPLLRFLPILAGMVVIVLIGGFCFHTYYRHPEDPQFRLSFPRAVYVTYCLIFMEHLHPFPSHPLLDVFYYLLPLLGLIVILEGLVTFGSRIVQRDIHGKAWVKAVSKTMSDHVILFGFGKLGLRVLEELIALGEQVVILEKDPLCPNLAFAAKHDIPVRIGTHREEDVLTELNIADAKSIILGTNDDLANLEMALDARKARPDIHVVLRMFDQELATKIRDAFDIHLAFSTSALAAPLFANSSSDRSIINSFYVGKQLLVVARIYVRSGSGLEGKSLRKLNADTKAFFLTHRRAAEQTYGPSDNVVLKVGDELTIQTEPDTLKQFHRWNQPAAK